jgi:hypothetical protein
VYSTPVGVARRRAKTGNRADQRISRERCIVHFCHCGSTFDPGNDLLDITTDVLLDDLSKKKMAALRGASHTFEDKGISVSIFYTFVTRRGTTHPRAISPARIITISCAMAGSTRKSRRISPNNSSPKRAKNGVTG